MDIMTRTTPLPYGSTSPYHSSTFFFKYTCKRSVSLRYHHHNTTIINDTAPYPYDLKCLTLYDTWQNLHTI